MLPLDQCQAEDQIVWLTTCLHPVISGFIQKLQEELSSRNHTPSAEESREIQLEEELDTQDIHMDDPDQDAEPKKDKALEPNPLPLMAQHHPRITSSNTKIQLMEGVLTQP